MNNLRRSHILGIFLLATLVAAPAVPGAQAAVGKEAAGKQVSKTYNVEVLRVRDGTIDGRKVWLVTVMKPGGNSNGAFQVHVLAVDQESGALVPSFRHHADGYTLPPPQPGGERP
jgi:hypothetical protein